MNAALIDDANERQIATTLSADESVTRWCQRRALELPIWCSWCGTAEVLETETNFYRTKQVNCDCCGRVSVTLAEYGDHHSQSRNQARLPDCLTPDNTCGCDAARRCRCPCACYGRTILWHVRWQ